MLNKEYSYAYQLTLEKGKWSSLLLRKPKAKKGGAKKKAQTQAKPSRDTDSEVSAFSVSVIDAGIDVGQDDATPSTPAPAPVPADVAVDLDDPTLTTPMPRYNAMLAILRNMLYMYVLYP